MLSLFKKTDKLLHLVAGILTTQCSYILSTVFLTVWWSTLLAFVIGMLVAAGKELIYDKALERGVCEKDDFIATMIGVGIETILLIITLLI